MALSLHMGDQLREERLAGVAAALLSFLGGLSVSRILYEWLFPRVLWLGKPAAALLTAGLVSLLGWLLWRRMARWLESAGRRKARWQAAIPFLPLLLNLAYLTTSGIAPIRGPFLFLVSLWLALLFAFGLKARRTAWQWLGLFFILALLLPTYLLTLGRTVGTADTFEFQVVVPKLGIVHPSGYPLYLLLTRLFTFLPIHNVAWRVNLATALYGIAAAYLLFSLSLRLADRPVPAVLSAVLFGLTPTFWSQAIEAEVYSLHAMLVAAALLLMRAIGDWRLAPGVTIAQRTEAKPGVLRFQLRNTKIEISKPYALTLQLAFVLGLGLTNHLTTVILLPSAALTLILSYRSNRLDHAALANPRSLIAILIAFLLPLLLYAYLPLRWAAVNGEAMGLSRFLDWVVGSRFQGALQLDSWLSDPTRYEITSRLFGAEWRPAWLLLVLVGAIWLFLYQWRFGLILLITWLGYLFHVLNYHVPDLAVFLIPAHLVMAIWWGVGLVAPVELLTGSEFDTHTGKGTFRPLLAWLLVFFASAAFALVAANSWLAIDGSKDDGRRSWGLGVLSMDLEKEGAILADSDKFPPLYYLQQAEGLRPDLDIMVLPDEAAYRAELAARLDAGQSVYLARFLPGLEGIYHLGSAGPLVGVYGQHKRVVPSEATFSDLAFGPVRLLGYDLETASPFAKAEAAINLYWQAEEELDEVLHVYTRLIGPGIETPATGQHPANNTYPTVAWEAGEVVSDYHALYLPIVGQPQSLAVQVTLAPPFATPEDTDWQTVTSLVVQPPDELQLSSPLRIQLGPVHLTGVVHPDRIRPQEPLPVTFVGYGEQPEKVEFALEPADSPSVDPIVNSQLPATSYRLQVDSSRAPGNRPLIIQSARLETESEPGRYDIIASFPGEPAVCGWLAQASDGCRIGQVEISGVPLPEGSTNFEGKIALLAVDLPEKTLQPGGKLPVNLVWQGLAPMNEDYTVFVQVLDGQDRIVGQVDSWPLQGTYGTSLWQPGEDVADPYLVQLDPQLEPGPYKLHVGWYLLETLRRLPILDENGAATDDKVVVPGLQVPATDG